jgi:hypothetical protein
MTGQRASLLQPRQGLHQPRHPPFQLELQGGKPRNRWASSTYTWTTSLG